MSARRFTPQQLRYLRNQIPIQSVIRSVNSADPQHSCFDCPLCGGRDTNINKPANLARCFACQKNFNPIEMVMALHRLAFVDAVNLLLGQGRKAPKMPAVHEPIAGNRASTPFVSTPAEPNRPTALGDIIPSVLNAVGHPQSAKNHCDGCIRLENSLAETQRRLSRIETLIARLNLSSPD